MYIYLISENSYDNIELLFIFILFPLCPIKVVTIHQKLTNIILYFNRR